MFFNCMPNLNQLANEVISTSQKGMNTFFFLFYSIILSSHFTKSRSHVKVLDLWHHMSCTSPHVQWHLTVAMHSHSFTSEFLRNNILYPFGTFVKRLSMFRRHIKLLGGKLQQSLLYSFLINTYFLLGNLTSILLLCQDSGLLKTYVWNWLWPKAMCSFFKTQNCLLSR